MTGPSPSPFRAGPPRWEVAPAPDESVVRRLSEALSLPLELCRLLVVRGHDAPESAKGFLRPLLEHLPAPADLKDLVPAAARILTAVDRGETILVHGDYDVDGACATAILTRWIRRLGGHAEPFVPHRMKDGYDLGPSGLRRAAEVGASLLVTVDCGIVAHGAVAQARTSGVDVIVTDHHAPGESLPPAMAVVNPNRADDDSGRGDLCGAGVAFQLVRHLAEARGIDLQEVLPDLDLVALATVADLVPLTEENRVLVRFGLRALERTEKPGLRALLEVCGLSGPLDSGKLGYTLAPRINAVGRLGDAGDAVRLLLTEDGEEARRLATEADTLNSRRQAADRETLAEALAQLDARFDPREDFGVVLAGRGWHPGVIGIVASRVVERIHRPVVLVALEDDSGRGSARSVPGFHLHRALTRCSDHLVRFGGHAQAAGMDLHPSSLEAFRVRFNEVVREALEPEPDLLRPRVRVDLEVAPDSLTLELAELARYLGPHGVGNPRPVLVARDLRALSTPRVVGNGHLKLDLGRNGRSVPAIGFGMAERFPPEALTSGRFDAAFQLTVNEFRGRRTPQMRLVDLRPAGEARGSG
ncbi:MAG: single-stranded-DNA-specific exonuclease RecJ [Gemmatimonadales bacterium]|nr:MAG: single-stranded-DNA-specific exonuclease RecJ [Gemmatimonadales bacterium]